MMLILNQADWDALQEQAPVTCPKNLGLDDVEKHRGGERLTNINIEIEPDCLNAFLQAEPQYGSDVHSLPAIQGRRWESGSVSHRDPTDAIACPTDVECLLSRRSQAALPSGKGV
jgi:hypothetical protein